MIYEDLAKAAIKIKAHWLLYEAQLALPLLGKASTGAAISGLEGAAATNASLAWLGGGAKSVGGWGMAAGEIVTKMSLGSLVIGIAGEATYYSGRYMKN